MEKYSWKFPSYEGPGDQGINDGGISMFKGSQLYNSLAREICQNSLDAKANGENTVIVKFKCATLNKKDYPSLSGLVEVFNECRVSWAKRMNTKLQNFLDDADNVLSNDDIDCLIISDSNTTGLSGVKKPEDERSKWRALTSSDGVTDKDDGSGGSYGIGKSAPFACSSLRTVFYNTYAKEDGIKAFQGVARLVSHNHNGKKTLGTGFYLNNETWDPIFDTEKCLLRDLINRKEYGTDVVIAGFKKTATWDEDIEKAVIQNFFVAIAKNELIVEINDIRLDSNTLHSRIEFYADKEVESKNKPITTILEFYHTIIEQDHLVIKGSVMEKEDVTLYIRKDENYSMSIVEMRSIGMVVRKRHKNLLSHYAAVMIVNEGKLNNLLKNIEPPKHDEWDPGILEDEDEKKDATNYKRKLIRWVNDTIIKNCRSEETDELDLDGVSAYLPFDETDESLGVEEKEDISPDSNSKVGEPTKTRPNVRKITISAKKVRGVKDEKNDPHNKTEGGSGGGHSGGIKDPSGKDDVISPTDGNKTLNIPKVLQQRIVQMPADSSYRVAFVLENDCKDVNIELKAVGDDRKKEKVNIIDYKIGKLKTNINSKTITLHDIKANEKNEIFLTLEYSEKMALQLLIF